MRPRWECCMPSAIPLNGRSILVVEDDALIRLELVSLFESVGAHVIAAYTCEQGVSAIERYHICAAILDHGLVQDNVAPLVALLTECQIPYMFYTGYPDLEQTYPRAIIVQKPASGDVLLAKMAAIANDPFDWIGQVGSRQRQRGISRERAGELAAD